ncbi:hypothetical protein [Haloferax prahovense]|uniref:hypothetical protein n=1 Tax=Haloferax prahovense TaxID=381852 RepID=UPI000679B0A1|nr:hypothetical protein [Haloferax prahovense]
MKRRALLSTVAGSALGLAAGCLSDLDEPVETPVNPQTTMATTDPPTETTTETTTETNTSEPDSSIGLSVVNEDDKSHTLSVRVTDGDETRFVGSLDIGAGPGRGRSVENDLVGERTVRVVAELEAGATLDYEWTVTDEARHLELVVTSDADLEPRQRVRPALDAADLPYTVTGAKDIFAPPGATIRNRSDADARLTVAIDHDGSRVFERAFDAATDREISTPALVASHGTYEVVVEAEDGRTATHEWDIPENWGWPTLAVLVAADGSLRVGSGWPKTASVHVENEGEAERDLTLTLVRPADADTASDDAGGETGSGGADVSETNRTAPPGESTVGFEVPIGDVYELTIETAAGSETVDYAACYCWNTNVTVTLNGRGGGDGDGGGGGDGDLSVESFEYVCS